MIKICYFCFFLILSIFSKVNANTHAQIEIIIESKSAGDFSSYTGSIIEILSSKGNTIFGLGTPRVVNTRYLNQSHLAVFVKDTIIKDNLRRIYKIDNPFKDSTGTYLYSDYRGIFASKKHNLGNPLKLNERRRTFEKVVNSGTLSQVYYKGKLIEYKEKGLSIEGNSFILFTERDNQSIQIGYVFEDHAIFEACDISKQCGLYSVKLDLEKGIPCSTVTLLKNYAKSEYIYSWGILNNKEFFFSTNRGNSYSISKNGSENFSVKTIFDNTEKISNQNYSILNY